ncbi:hypothetical protein [uncultured Aquimarina sp.]|uniref:hypothetical protein n=1 Tax=uncultured Aquimarina sp. TaxID=575652 RepID=UPI00260236C1|nr:hypothetical protein [uncultured Aquimarina sp.]
MKTKLLYLASFMLVLFTACSVDENTQLSEQEKDLKVKSLIKTFAEEIQPSDSYKKFIEEIKSRSKNTSNYSEEELKLQEQEFLSQQTPEFVELYYLVSEMNLSKEELRVIVIEYYDGIKSMNVGKSEEDGHDCAAATEANNTNILWHFLSDLICEVIN